jgi:hypothetical protein
MYATRRNHAIESKVFYEVPTLSPPKLLECLNEIQLPFTEEDLLKPQALRTQYLFERILDLLMGVRSSQIEEVRDKALQHVETPVSIRGSGTSIIIDMGSLFCISGDAS